MDQIRKKFLIWETNKNSASKDDLLQEIWKVYHPKLQVYLSQFNHGKNNTADIVSDILIKVFESISFYKSGYSFSTWIYTLARNHQIDLLRKKTLLTDNIDDHVLFDSNTPESIMVESINQNMVREAVSCLSSIDREIIYLHYYEEMKYKEISMITGIPVGTIKYRMSENKKKLKRELERSMVL